MKTNKNFKSALTILIMLIANTASADWDTPKWAQLPDVTPLGMDVQASSIMFLADDFLCTDTGPITDIHIWGSWLNDYLPKVNDIANAANVTFNLSIYADQPADSQGYSQPLGSPLWSTQMGPDSVRIERDNLNEGWYDPYTGGYISSADTVCWQYNFLIDPQEAFIQQGTPSNPIVYWLALNAMPEDPLASFGWKTSIMHWNDDAVWEYSKYPESWNEMTYPDGHFYQGQSVDLAFVITTPEPATFLILATGGALIIRMRRTKSTCN